MSTIFNQCMLCKHPKLVFVHKLRDDDTRDVYKCSKCGHVQVVPLPPASEDYSFYQSGEMYNRLFANSEEFKSQERIAERFRPFVEYQVKKLVPYLHADWTILEIGSAYGWLVQRLQERGYNVDGVEITNIYREIYRKRTGKELLSFNLLTDDSETLERQEYYDCIVLCHTLEHISDPVLFITRAAKLLKRDGMIYIDVPNEEDYMMSISPEYANYHYMRGHLSYFTPRTLELLLVKCGFADIKIVGNQIYSPENVSQWLRYNEPFRDYHQIELPEPIQWLNRIYKDRVEAKLKSFAIIAIGRKI